MLTRSPLEQVLKRLENKNEWKSAEGSYYNFYNSEFTITINNENEEYDRRRPEFYSYALMNSSTILNEILLDFRSKYRRE